MGLLVDRLLAPVAVIAADSTLLYVNPAAAQAVGSGPGSLLGRRMLDLIHPDDRERVTRELQQVSSGQPPSGVTTYRLRADGAQDWRVFESIADNLVDDPTVAGILISARDITEQRARERDLYEVAFRDALTGLPSRAKVLNDLDVSMGRTTPLTVALIGVDRFQLVNDSLGQTVGDDVLRAVGSRLVTSLLEVGRVGRLHSDVFAVLLEGIDDADAHALLWRIVERIGEPFFIASRELRLSSSVGVAHRRSTGTAESLLHDAGLALHRAKAAGRGRVEVFATTMRDQAVARLELEADLRAAITNNELSMVLQPIVRLADRTAVGAEALLRWYPPYQASITPDVFIPVAEETGLIVPLGDWTIERAAQLVHRVPGGGISVNLSARHLASPGLPERISRTLASQRLPGSALAFEITETLLIEQFEYAVIMLNALRDLGCLVGLDDFGTGYSSLAYLRRLPIDFLKIDGSLIADIDSDPQSEAITQAIITMGHALGHYIVAEGVETEAQAEALRAIGCEFGQGYFFGRPAEPPS
jgi:diguanylate cyclase (GGDEF)-like protein/PAS domain S-box-containing protein